MGKATLSKKTKKRNQKNEYQMMCSQQFVQHITTWTKINCKTTTRSQYHVKEDQGMWGLNQREKNKKRGGAGFKKNEIVVMIGSVQETQCSQDHEESQEHGVKEVKER